MGLSLFDFICNVQGNTITFRIFTALILACLFLPQVLQHGLFMDGAQYAVVARNLYQGEGTFWFPFLSSTWNREGIQWFMEQPPLFYFLESFFFRVFGDNYYTEKLFCLFVLLLSAFFIHAIWQILFKKNTALRELSWLPVLLWFLSPSVSWVYKNNLIESCLSVFVLSSVYFFIRAMQKPGASQWFYLLLGGFFVFCGSLTKGLPGFFPLMVPLLYFITTRRITFLSVFHFSLLCMGVPLLLYFLLWNFHPLAHKSLAFYLENRLLNRIQHDPTVKNHFTILFWLMLDLLPMLAVLALALLVSKSFLSELTEKREIRQHSFLFFLVGLAGVLPLCLTKVQREMYYVPAIPFFSISIALLLAVPVQKKITLLNRSLLRKLCLLFAGCLLVCISFSFLKMGEDCRDEEVLQDVRAIGSLVGINQLLYTPYEVYARWDLQFYLLRYYNIQVSGEHWANVYSRIYNKNDTSEKPKQYKRIELKTLDLFLKDSALIKK